MYAWLENVDNRGFEVCVREFLPFDGKHQDAVVVSVRIEPFFHLCHTYFQIFTAFSEKIFRWYDLGKYKIYL